MDFSDLRKLKSSKTLITHQEDEKFTDFSRRRSQNLNHEGSTKNVLIIYASGSLGANKDLQIERGGLKKMMSSNFFLCDFQHSKKCDSKLQYLMTPLQQTGIRIRYKIIQTQKIDSSINLNLQNLNKVADIIYEHYEECNAFIIVTGLDTICHVGTTLSFMFQNLSKLVICTGGYLPLSRMRNDSVSNLVQCFTVVSQASSINDVLIVSKNKGFRANRCIKMTEGDFQNISSPNLPALCSIKTKLRVRSYLFQPLSQGQFSIFKQMSNKIKVLRLQQFESIQSLQYQLKNPFIKGIVIVSFSFANIPNLPQMLKLFKEAYEDQNRKTIFINISQAIVSKNDSLMKYQLQKYHIHYGGDITLESALSKLSYLIGKGYPQQLIIKQIQKNLRGELTEQNQKLQYTVQHTGMMKIVDQALSDYFPSTLKQLFYHKIQSNVSRFLIYECTQHEFNDIFLCEGLETVENDNKIAKLANQHYLLHRAAQSSNMKMAKYLIQKGAQINIQNQNYTSPLFDAIKKSNKPMIQLLSKNGGRVICRNEDLFQILIQAIKKDDTQFFNLLYHIQFKQTMKQIKNYQLRTVAHIAGILKSAKCFKLMKQKFNIPLNQEDAYGKTANQYFLNNIQ